MTERFWVGEPGWVLIRSESGLPPFNTESQMAHVIDDEEEAERTYREMVDDGVPIVDDLPPPVAPVRSV